MSLKTVQLMLLLFFVFFCCCFFQKQRQGFLVLLINLNICLCICVHIIFCFSITWHQILLFIIQRSFELYNFLYLFKINLLFLKKIRKIFLFVFFNALLSSSTHCRSVIVTSLTSKLDYRKGIRCGAWVSWCYCCWRIGWVEFLHCWWESSSCDILRKGIF